MLWNAERAIAHGISVHALSIHALSIHVLSIHALSIYVPWDVCCHCSLLEYMTRLKSWVLSAGIDRLDGERCFESFVAMQKSIDLLRASRVLP